MPIFRSESKLYFFSHIPKCGGSSVEKYCIDLGLKIAFRDIVFFKKHRELNWNITSPQHIDGWSASHLFGADFFDMYFAITRHPIKRLESAFKHQRFYARSVVMGDSLSEFVKETLKDNALTIGFCDNHFLPQTKFIIPHCNYKIFKLESGLHRVKKYLDDTLFGEKQNANISHSNKGVSKEYIDKLDLSLDDEAKDIVLKIYQKDFKKFNYSIE